MKKQFFVYAHSEKQGDIDMVVEAENAGLAPQEVADEMDLEVVTLNSHDYLVERGRTPEDVLSDLNCNMGSPRWAYELFVPVQFYTYRNLLGSN
jgi:hypothetical protein